MAKIRRHVPSFVDMDEEPETVEFTTVEELLEIPFVNDWNRDEDFFRFSIGSRKNRISLLMAEFDKGKAWYVVGHMENVNDIELPDWKPVYKE